MVLVPPPPPAIHFAFNQSSAIHNQNKETGREHTAERFFNVTGQFWVNLKSFGGLHSDAEISAVATGSGTSAIEDD